MGLLPFLSWDYLDYNPREYVFRRTVRDNHPYSIIKNDDNSSTLICNVLGIDEKDLKIEIQDDKYLVIEGSTTVKDQVYMTSFRFTIDTNRIENIKYYTKNGLLYIDLIKREIEKPRLMITRAEEE